MKALRLRLPHRNCNVTPYCGTARKRGPASGARRRYRETAGNSVGVPDATGGSLDRMLSGSNRLPLNRKNSPVQGRRNPGDKSQSPRPFRTRSGSAGCSRQPKLHREGVRSLCLSSLCVRLPGRFLLQGSLFCEVSLALVGVASPAYFQ